MWGFALYRGGENWNEGMIYDKIKRVVNLKDSNCTDMAVWAVSFFSPDGGEKRKEYILNADRIFLIDINILV